MHGCVELMRSGEISRGLRMREHVRRIPLQVVPAADGAPRSSGYRTIYWGRAEC